MKQIIGKVSVVAFFALMPFVLIAQNSPTFTMNGAINSTNNMSFSATTAGENPAKLELFNTANNYTNNTSLMVKYRWPFWGTENEEETYLIGSIRVVSSAAIPSGLLWTINAPVPSSTLDQYGLSTGTQTLSTTQAILVDGIWSTASGWFPFFSFMAKTINCPLTQVLSVTNFADIHPTPGGTYQTFVLTFTLE